MPFNNHQFLPITPEDWQNGPHQLDGLTVADLKMIYNALLMEVFSDGERAIGPITVLEKVLEAIIRVDRSMAALP